MLTIEEVLQQEHKYIAGTFDVVVVGAGHAGCEAAHACAKLGLSTILFTLQLDSLANINTLDDEHLSRELEKAIEAENYRLASTLHEELQRRNKQ